MAPRNWWKILLAVLLFGGAGVMYMGVGTYKQAPPKPDFVSPDGEVLVSVSEIEEGQLLFLKYALMQYGSMFGDGAIRGPDFTADALDQTALGMRAHYEATLDASADEATRQAALDGIAAKIKREIKANSYNEETNQVELTAGQAAAVARLQEHYRAMFAGEGLEGMRPQNYITDPNEIKQLSAFFFWGGWVCGVQRPGGEASYTHNWPYSEVAGNTPSAATLLWSVIGALALIVAVGFVLYLYGKMSDLPSNDDDKTEVATAEIVASTPLTDLQRSTYKFFAVAVVLFLFQIIAGILTIHDFVGFTQMMGMDISTVLPITVTRSWHVQFAVQWIATCWIAGSIFILPRISPGQPPGQVRLINLLFWILVFTVAGTLIGGVLGPHGVCGDYWRWLGNQGWEFVELGKLFQITLFVGLLLWAWIVIRGVKPVLKLSSPFSLPYWLVYAVIAISILFLSSFVAGERTNFVIADFWRWMVIHMWAECFFEVFTTMIVAYYMVLMGLVGKRDASRAVYFATLLFLGSGFIGISHNFYWNAKPEPTLALGSVFSTMQVVPLIMLTVAAWKFRKMPKDAMRQNGNGKDSQFGMAEPFLFLLAVNFWNFFGAGVFGFIINLPIVNYYEHGTYLTVNHGHAALMGVYGNLSIAAVLFCSRYLIPAERWNAGLLRMVFWSMNIGLMLMVMLDTFPAGVAQLHTVLTDGYVAARSQEFIQGDLFQTLTWLRAIGGVLFFLGGVVPLTHFMVSRWRDVKRTTDPDVKIET